MSESIIQVDPAVMMGKPVIAGTRITVELILLLEKLAAGETVEQIIEAHPRLTREAVLGVLEHAEDSLMDELLASNPKFQAMAAKSKAGRREPFPTD